MSLSQPKHVSASPTAPAIENTVPYGVSHFYLNHPRNYLIPAIAAAHSLDTASLIQKYAAGSGSQAKSGSEVLGLLDADNHLTARGVAVVEASQSIYESETTALKDLHSLHGSSARFVDERPQWAETVRETALSYRPAQVIASILQETGTLSLPDLLVEVSETESIPFARDLFIKSGTEIPFRRLKQTNSLGNPAIYKGTTVYQLKSFLYHCGVLEAPGVDTGDLDPSEQTWTLSEQAHDAVAEAGGESR